MRNISNKTYWVVGASDGIGYDLVKRLDKLGVSLIISARNKTRLLHLSKSIDKQVKVVPCDVTDIDSVKSAFASVGKIDGVVYLAGDYTPMHAQDWNEQEVIKMADTNFMGALRVLGTCVPGFVERDEGHIVIIGSLAGFTGLQGSIGYGASKAALMHLAENLSADFYQSKIRVQLFNPGFVDTKLTLKNKFYMPFKMSTERAAAIIANGMLTNKSVINFPWLFSLIFRIGRILPIKYSIFGRKNNI